MITVSIEEAQVKLADLIRQLVRGEQVLITENNRPVAQLTEPASDTSYPIPGRCEGMLTVLVEDDEHLEDWADYLP